MSRLEDRILFSYSRKDAEFAARLGTDLRAAGVRVWIDQLDIPPGARWDQAIHKALVESRSVLVILSPHSVASDNVGDEVGYALDEGRTVIPVLYEPCEIPFRLRRLQYVDFTQDYASALERLEAALRNEVHDRADALDRMGGAAGRSAPEPANAARASTALPSIGKRLPVLVAAIVILGLAAVSGWRSFRSGDEPVGSAVPESVSADPTSAPTDVTGPPAPLLRADVDGYESPPGETQPGFRRMTGPGMTGNGSNGIYNLRVESSGITVLASGLAWRDRDVPPSHQSVPHVIRDMIGACGEDAEITITIAGLAAGTYEVTTYHVDWHVAANPNHFDILVYDARGKGRLVREHIDFAPDVNYLGETYEVSSNGRDEVVIRLRENSETDNCVRFNGIVIVPA